MPEEVISDVVRHRPTARVLLVDTSGRTLLFRGVSEDEARGAFWFPPGGAIERGEDATRAAIREVREETGLELDDPGSPIYFRRHVVHFEGVLTSIEETWFLARCAPFAIDTKGFTEFERDQIRAHRWFTPDELAACTERLVPLDLAERVECILRDGPPAVPEQLGA